MFDRFETQRLRQAADPAAIAPGGNADAAATMPLPFPAHHSDRRAPPQAALRSEPRQLASAPARPMRTPARASVRMLALLALLALSGCQPRQTGMFSTLELDKNGLLYGYEIFIVKADRGAGAGPDYYAVVQCADGKVGPPSIGQVTMTADQVRIALPSHAPPGCPSSTFIGTVGFKQLSGHFVGGEQLALARTYSFWE
jgi:hypothetical protein